MRASLSSIFFWPNGPKCPHCGSKWTRRQSWNGASTRIGALLGLQLSQDFFSVTHGTFFLAARVTLPLLQRGWRAIYLTDGGTKPMRPHHLQQILNVSFKTASST